MKAIAAKCSNFQGECQLDGRGIIDIERGLMGFYNLKIINCGDRRLEIYYSKDYKIKTGEVKKKNVQCVKIKSEEQLKYEEDEMTREEIFKKAASLLIQSGENGQAQEMLRTGIKEIADSAELRTAYISALLGDGNVERQLCDQTIKEQLKEMPELEKDEEFEKLVKQYGINLEGEKIW